MLAVSKNTESTLAKRIELANPNFSQKRIASMENSEQLSRFLASFLEDGFWYQSFCESLSKSLYQKFLGKVSVAGLSFQSSTSSLWKVAGRGYTGGSQLPHTSPVTCGFH